MSGKKRLRSGLTLLELTIAMVILSIIIVSLAAAVKGGLDNYSHNASVSNVNQIARALLSRMTDQVRIATDVQLLPGKNGVRITVPIPHSATTRTCSYYLSGGQFITVVDGDSSVVLQSTDEARVDDFAVDLKTDPGTGLPVRATFTLTLRMTGTSKTIQASGVLRSTTMTTGA